MAALQENIVLKTRNAIVLACVSGVAVGFGAFAIFHYLNTRKHEAQSSNNSPRRPRAISRLSRHYSDEVHDVSFPDTIDEDDLEELNEEDQVKALREKNYQLQNLLTIARTQKYDISNPNTLSASDIETIRSIFDSMDLNQDGCATDQEIINIYSKLGEPLTEKEAKQIIFELDPRQTNEISFDTFLSWWHEQHKGGKRNKSYAQKFKFLCAGLKSKNFDLSKIVVKPVGQRATTEFRFTFHYIQSNNKLKQISPWHDIPLHHFKHQNIFNFVCEIPKWSRAKYEISTGEAYNPIHQDVKNGKLRFYQHGDMMFNYGALPQTWENPKLTPEDTGCPGDNDPLDVIEFGTKQLATGSVTAVKILGVLSLLDSGETDWKVLAININDPLANLMNDVHDFDTHMPGAIEAIREYLRIYKVCTGASENKYAFRGEALNSEYALKIIEETHHEWSLLQQQKLRQVSAYSSKSEMKTQK
eukprot:148088_1